MLQAISSRSFGRSCSRRVQSKQSPSFERKRSLLQCPRRTSQRFLTTLKRERRRRNLKISRSVYNSSHASRTQIFSLRLATEVRRRSGFTATTLRSKREG